VLIALGGFLAFVNALLLGWGANVWGGGALLTGLVFAAVVVPVFAFRHYVRDGGKFPDSMYTPTDATGAVPATAAPAAPASGPTWHWPVACFTVIIGHLLAG